MREYHFFTDDLIDQKTRFVKLTNKEAHHAINVMRLGRGDHVYVVDSKGHMIYGEIISYNPDEVEVLIKEDLGTRDDRYDLIIICSILKGDAMDFLIQKATELGVKAIYPVITDHCVVKLDSDSRIKKHRRYIEIAKQSLKQCRSFMMPEIMHISTLGEVIDDLKTFDGGRIWLWEEKQGQDDLISVFESFGRKMPVYMVFGCEGGFSSKEVNLLKEANFVPATLGERILRAETAVISAVSVICAYLNFLGRNKTKARG